MANARDFLMKIGDTKGTFHAKMGPIKTYAMKMLHFSLRTHVQGGLMCCSPWGCKELDLT